MNTTRTATGAEPIPLAAAKLFLKVDFTTDDTLITEIITAAREQAEKFCARSFVAQTIVYQETIPDEDIELETELRLPYPNHIAISEVKVNGDVTTSYTNTGLNHFVVKIAGLTVGDDNENAEVQVTYTAGDCPAGVKIALYNIIREMYFNRSDMVLSENAYVWLTPYICYQ